MSQNIKADIDLDLKGLVCPIPMVKVSQNIKKIDVGKILKATTSDPGSLSDIPSWARSTENEVLRIDKGKDEFVFYIKRLN